MIKKLFIITLLATTLSTFFTVDTINNGLLTGFPEIKLITNPILATESKSDALIAGFPEIKLIIKAAPAIEINATA
jgi:hypothetical protein